MFVELQFPFWEDLVDVLLLQERDGILKESRINHWPNRVLAHYFISLAESDEALTCYCVQVCGYLPQPQTCDFSRTLGVDEQQ